MRFAPHGRSLDPHASAITNMYVTRPANSPSMPSCLLHGNYPYYY